MHKLEMLPAKIVRGRAARRATPNARYYDEPAKPSGRITPHQGKREIARRLKRSTKGE